MPFNTAWLIDGWIDIAALKTAQGDDEMKMATREILGALQMSLLMTVSFIASAAVSNPPAAAVVPVPQPNGDGASLTMTTLGTIDGNNPFFKPFGNGRTCASCHQGSQGWSVSPDSLQVRFAQSNGNDPIFKLNDGANSPNAVVTTLDQKRLAYSMLLTKGLIRVGIPIPAGAEFSLVKVDDPYGYASAKELSLFRRPLPTTNLKFISSVMWDARETFSDAKSPLCIKDSRPAQCFSSVDFDLLHQSNSAVTGHAQAAQGLSAAEQRAIVDFEKTMFSAQITSNVAGSLVAVGAKGGPDELAKNNFYFGINDVDAGDYITGAAFNRNAMAMFGAWRGLDVRPPSAPPIPGRPNPPPPPAPSAVDVARASIARGEELFNNRPFNITNVSGFNDELRRPLQRGTCTSCHSTPNAGTHSVPRQFNTGTSAALLRTPDLPLYTLKNLATGEVIEVTDPGSALQSGKWKDIGRIKVPSLRALGSRAPYFHNGSSRDLSAVVKFYDKRFAIGLTPQEVLDMTAFLKAL